MPSWRDLYQVGNAPDQRAFEIHRQRERQPLPTEEDPMAAFLALQEQLMPPDPFDLMGGGGLDTSAISGEVNAEFGGVLSALDQAAAQARANAETAKKSTQGTYAALVNELNKLPGAVGQTFETERAQQGQLHQQRLGELNAGYEGAEADFTKELQELGLQAAAPETLGAINADQANWQAQAATQQSAFDQFLNSMQAGHTSIAQGAVGSAQREGAQRVTDLDQMLNEALNEIGMQRTQVAGQRQAALSKAMREAGGGGRDFDDVLKFYNQKLKVQEFLQDIMQSQSNENYRERALALRSQPRGPDINDIISSLADLGSSPDFTPDQKNALRDVVLEDLLGMSGLDTEEISRVFGKKKKKSVDAPNG